MAATVSAEDWREWSGLVAQLKLQPLVEEQDTRVINATDTMMDALSLLSTHNILSVPVYDSTTGGFVGLIDQLDLVAFLCRFSGSLSGTKRLEREQLNLQALKQQLESLSDDQRTQIRTAPVRGLIGLSERTTWEPVSVNTPPQTLVKMLADPNVHRLPVAAEDGDRFLGILTQLDVAKWLHQHVSAIPQPLRGRRVRDFVWPGSRKELATVPLHTTVIEVLLKIDEAKVSALPVVDAQGQLKGNISASDIAKLGLEPSDQPEQMLQKLFIPVSHFLSGPPVTCTMDSSVEDLLATFATHRVHRVWTVDNNSRPVGVVSLCDVFAQFVPQAETYIK